MSPKKWLALLLGSRMVLRYLDYQAAEAAHSASEAGEVLLR